MGPRPLAPVLVLLAALLPGCSGGGGDGDVPDGLVATEETGIVRGVVVDQGIRPLPGANVTLVGGTHAYATTGEDGAFGFGGLAPGSYRVMARKPGYLEAATGVNVEAGVDEPRAVNLVLVYDAGLVPYVDLLVFEGFLECSFHIPTQGYFAACRAGPIASSLVCDQASLCLGTNGTNDHSYVFLPVSIPPTFVQAELVWDSTQAFGEGLSLYLGAGTWEQVANGGYETNMNVSSGPSPVHVTVDAERIADAELGTVNGLVPQIVAAANGDTTQCLPTGECDGAGAAAEQQFTVYNHLFYNYLPPPDWRFSTAGGAPPPPA